MWRSASATPSYTCSTTESPTRAWRSLSSSCSAIAAISRAGAAAGSHRGTPGTKRRDATSAIEFACLADRHALHRIGGPDCACLLHEPTVATIEEALLHRVRGALQPRVLLAWMRKPCVPRTC